MAGPHAFDPEKSEPTARERADIDRASSSEIGDATGDHPRGLLRRLTLSLVPAAGMTSALFVAMAGLIAVDFKPAEAEEARLIGTITPAPIEEIEVRKRLKPRTIETATQPPPLPRLAVHKTSVDLPALDFPPVTLEIEPGPVQVLDRAPTVFADGEVLPIRRPVVNYPESAIRRGLEGDCVVSMDVSAKGRPFNIVADCTDAVFQRAAVQAISRVEFRPKIVEGAALERRNVVYPLSFKLQ